MSEDAVKRFGLEGQAIEIVAQTMATDFPSAFEGDKEDNGPCTGACNHSPHGGPPRVRDLQVQETYTCNIYIYINIK